MEGMVTEPHESELIDEVVQTLGKRKRRMLWVCLIILFLAGLYLGLSIYFTHHFYFGSSINCINVSGKHVDDVNALMQSELNCYTLTLLERGGRSEVITAEEIGLAYADDAFAKLKHLQRPYRWLFSLLKHNENSLSAHFYYDDSQLEQRIDALSCFEPENAVAPKNASLEVTDTGYVIVPETEGSLVDKKILARRIARAVLKKQGVLNLDSVDCYQHAEYTGESPKILAALRTLNRYASTHVTYTVGERTEVLDRETISSWLTVDEKLRVQINLDAVKAYAKSLAVSYNTVGTMRCFVTSSGEGIDVGGGDYGTIIDTDKETEELLRTIKRGETITREPFYLTQSLARSFSDIGNTYVEISLSEQHLWFYKDGALIIDGPIVTGNVSAGHTTPPGVYKLKYKCTDVVLRGPDYAAPVTYWMPFNGGIGIHDANWRSDFGGTIYQSSGSHGCINCPYSLAKAVYENITSGVPVICYTQ